MKNFLAVDTGSKYMTVLVVKDGKKTVVFEPDCAMRHSVKLMHAVDEALKQADCALQELDFFACVVGAGSFTGIRIGISTVKGFALATGKPMLPVTSFDLAAYNVEEAAHGEGGKLLVLSDALHGAYYACGYGAENRVICPPAYLTEEEVLALEKEGYTLASLEPVALKTLVCDPAEGLFKAVTALCAQDKFGELNALYVRKSQAEINLEAANTKSGSAEKNA